MNLAEVFLLLAAVALPLLLGWTAAVLRKPWWWAAVLGVAIVMIVMIAPQPEPGESRVAVGDLPFLLIVDLVVVGLVWLAYYLARRFWVRRSKPRRAAAS